ncbi:hypothetical protein [Chromobacterium rhizoryzae]|uniref:hypothetical protein n=1 Tax=Chromobacterium rhizoryzae TaxID=1778675 RepID=UPI001D0933D4|nr:hypothetical protein [Chromobacterium rhizoryzae]UJB30680.1 hypothetical protein HQN78_06120 [Chromobacterium sp. Beijing]
MNQSATMPKKGNAKSRPAHLEYPILDITIPDSTTVRIVIAAIKSRMIPIIAIT